MTKEQFCNQTQLDHNQHSENADKSFQENVFSESGAEELLPSLTTDIMAAETEASMVKHVCESAQKGNIAPPDGFYYPESEHIANLIAELQNHRETVSSLAAQNSELKDQIAALTEQVSKLVVQTREAGDTVIAMGETGKSEFFVSAGKMISGFRDFVKETRESIDRKFTKMKDLLRGEKIVSDDEHLLSDIVTDADTSEKTLFNNEKLLSFDFLKNACEGIKSTLLNSEPAQHLYQMISEGIQNSRYQHALHESQSFEKRAKAKTETLKTIQRCDEAIFTAKSGFMKAFHIAKGTPFVENRYEPSAFCSKLNAQYMAKIGELNAEKGCFAVKAITLMPESIRKAKARAQQDLNFLKNIEPITKD